MYIYIVMTSPISLIIRSFWIHLVAATPRHISLEAIESKCSTWHLGSCGAIFGRVENQAKGAKLGAPQMCMYRVLYIHIYIYHLCVCVCVYQCMYSRSKYISVSVCICMFNAKTYVCMHIIYKIHDFFIVYIYLCFLGCASKLEMSLFAVAVGDSEQCPIRTML